MKQIPGKDKVLSMLGLAARSRNVVSGAFATEQTAKSGEARLVIIAEDASGNTRKKYDTMCDFYRVPSAVYGTKAVIGHSMRREERSVLAVTDEGFANSIQKHLADSK